MTKYQAFQRPAGNSKVLNDREINIPKSKTFKEFPDCYRPCIVVVKYRNEICQIQKQQKMLARATEFHT